MIESLDGAQLVVCHPEVQGVESVFAILGATIDHAFDALRDSSIMTVCRHEQDAVFIAGWLERITGKASVVPVTSSWSRRARDARTSSPTSPPQPSKATVLLPRGAAVAVAERVKQAHGGTTRSP